MKVPAAAVEPPMVTLSAVPPLMSAVVNTALGTVTTPVELAIVAAAVPSAAEIEPVSKSETVVTPAFTAA